MLYYSRRSRLLFVLAALFTSATILSTLVLGFHYTVDAIAALPVAALTIFLARSQSAHLLPSLITPAPDEVTENTV